jgi:peptide/nickel transport system ATP-binding protein
MASLKRGWLRNSRLNPNLILGLLVVSFVVLAGIFGPMLVNEKLARVGAVEPNLPPSTEYSFGTDSQGREVFTTLILAIPPTLRVGVIAGVISVVLGLVLGLTAGFFGGWADWLTRVFADVLIAVPALAFMILVISRMDRPNIVIVAVIVGLLTWPATARGIRSMVLTIRERTYTAVARANGESELGVLFREVMPNLLPLMLASFIAAVTIGVYTVMALEVLGLGNNVIPTLGMMIFWSQRFSAVLRGMWWWWSPPIIMIALLFIGLFLLSSGLDRFVNPTIPRMRRRSRSGLEMEPMPVGTIVPSTDSEAVLQVKNLRVVYDTQAGHVKAVDDVSFTLLPGERMGLIGESGSGKTTMATAIMRLSRPPARIVGGQILLDGRDLLSLSDEELRKLRLKEIALMPQAAMNSLNPVVRIGPQIKDAIVAHLGRMSQQQLDTMVAEILTKVGLRPEIANRFPHQLSGGMKQRVAMAIAIVLKPKVIIADEPTSALDVVVQQQVMETLGALQRELGVAVLLIGHDMGLIAQFSDSIGVLYAGKLVERGGVQDVLQNPFHPYTRMLIDSLPGLEEKKDLVGIPGLPPALANLPSGCAFHPRCPFAHDRCRTEIPVLQSPSPDRQVACHLYPERTKLPPIKETDGLSTEPMQPTPDAVATQVREVVT